jgi:hypothetical protein
MHRMSGNDSMDAPKDTRRRNLVMDPSTGPVLVGLHAQAKPAQSLRKRWSERRKH